MATYDIVLKTGDSDAITSVSADAYQQEGPMTTFFQLDADRRVIDCWSVRVASFRTVDIGAVLRVDEPSPRRGAYRHECAGSATASLSRTR